MARKHKGDEIDKLLDGLSLEAALLCPDCRKEFAARLLQQMPHVLASADSFAQRFGGLYCVQCDPECRKSRHNIRQGAKEWSQLIKFIS